MSKNIGLAAIFCAGLAGGCAWLRWTGSDHPQDTAPGGAIPESGLKPKIGSARQEEKEPLPEIRTSTAPARRRPEDYLPKTLTEEQRQTMFYSDLGPDEIDVSNYPTQQKYNYSVFLRVCSQCHTPARAINAPFVSRTFWQFYLYGMRTRSRFHLTHPLTREETNSVLDFLECDAHERKTAGKRDFEELNAELRKRFEAILEERLRGPQH